MLLEKLAGEADMSEPRVVCKDPDAIKGVLVVETNVKADLHAFIKAVPARPFGGHVGMKLGVDDIILHAPEAKRLNIREVYRLWSFESTLAAPELKAIRAEMKASMSFLPYIAAVPARPIVGDSAEDICIGAQINVGKQATVGDYDPKTLADMEQMYYSSTLGELHYIIL